MCGIVGFVQHGGLLRDEATLVSSKMADTIVHRGPDDLDVWIDGTAGVALAHCRLAVIDLSATGRQPMVSQSGRYVITFNGEIYNHLEIRRRLEILYPGTVMWKGTSDTESLLAAIECFGLEDTLQQSVGMFAFGLWDRQEKTLYLARDRFGEKPLYFGWQNHVFIFSSELKAMACHPSFEGVVDRGALALYMRYGYIPAPWSIYEGVQKLIPGAYLALAVGRGSSCIGKIPEPSRYWSLPEVIKRGTERPFEGDTGEAVEALHELLRQAVASQVVADVPLGAFLSGGIDSSTIVAMMQAHSSQPVKTFTIGFGEAGYNEAVQARKVADVLGTDHTELYVSPQDALNTIPRLPVLYDEPFADSSQIPTSLVAELARRHVTVALSGDGGDEVFGGYARYSWTRDLWTLLSPIPNSIRRIYQQTIAAVPSRWTSAGIMGKARMISDILNYQFQSVEQLYFLLVSHWRSPTSIVKHADERRTFLSDRSTWSEASELESRMMAIDTLTYLPDDILVKVDRASMAVSLETRAPFLDHRVVEFAWRLPLSVKIKARKGKWILRQVLHNHVPKKLVERPKRGFIVPIESWLRGPLREWAEALLDERQLRLDGFFQVGPIRERWAEHVGGRRQWDRCLWDVLMFQAWLQTNPRR